MMRVAEAIGRAVPGAQYRGDIDAGTREQYDRLQWNDARPKPSWDELEAIMAADSAKVSAKRSRVDSLLAKLRLTRQDVPVLAEALALYGVAADEDGRMSEAAR